MTEAKQNVNIEKLLVGLIVTINLLYFASCFFVPSIFLLAGSFASEAAYLLYFQNRKTTLTLYRDCGPLFSLGKAALFCLSYGGLPLFIPFLFLEISLLAFYQASYYFKYLASSLPSLNFKNFGQLDRLFFFSERLVRYRNALYGRPLGHLIIVILVVLPPVYNYIGLGIFLLIVTGFTGTLIFSSIQYVRYIKFGGYENDLAKHTAHHSPEVVVYVSGAPGSSYQLAQWLPVLEQLDRRVTVIAREKFWIDDLRDSPLHTVFARGVVDIENFLTQDTRICLYPANAFKNTQMMRRAELKHIFINHGDSDKIVNVSRLISAYTKLYLAGPMAKDRLEAAGISIAKDQFAYVGRPQTSLFLKSSGKTANILYAPTWEGFDAMSNYNSVGTLALDILKFIVELTDYNILFKPHPLTGTVDVKLRNNLLKIHEYLQKTRRGRFIQQGNILKLMNQCDIMITDISSVMNDFLATGKPYVVTNTTSISSFSFEKKFLTVQGGYIICQANEITNILQSITDTDPKKMVREQVKKYSLGEFACSALEKFKKEIEQDCIIFCNTLSSSQ